MRLCLALTIAVLCAGCASNQPEPDPEARACLPERKLIRGTPSEQLTQLTERARVFSECMQAKGYVLDETALDNEMIRKEFVLNADARYGDPQQALDIHRQELILQPVYWNKSGPVTATPSS
jgi:hypothetical protein